MYKSTVDPPNTIFTTKRGGGPLVGSNGNMFMPTAGIQKSGGEDTDKNADRKTDKDADKNIDEGTDEEDVLIKVKNHSQSRESLEEDMRHFIGEDMKAAMEKVAGGKLVVEWWERDLEGGKGAEMVDEDVTHVWWEIADVNVVYEDPAGI
ncbi:hypothetical protein CC86DRAFT_386266 [Ophiobolus disseminans]|uniref:Uncharacterized protein n=1 Tax=Ophiobolus disseminans TaxID=1469910 RepID=A0A6A6ZJK9_9PLEO|nr:hypothetical protein CC86DRAFT_386266 [Ophiobolus disseminans]